jgi:Flp pilus assembly protein TadB
MGVLLIFLGLLLISTTVLALILKPQSSHSLSQVRFIKNMGRTKEEREKDEVPLLIRLVMPIYKYLLSRVKLSSEKTKELAYKLELADIKITPYQVISPVQYITIKLIATFFVILFFGSLYLINPITRALINFIIAVFVVYFGFDEIIETKVKNKHLQMQAELPDFIDSVRIYLLTGLGIRQAISNVIPISGPGLKENLQKLKTDFEVFNNEVFALKRFAERCAISDIDFIVNMLEQGQESGMELKDIFLKQSTQIRERSKNILKQEIKKRPTYLAVVGVLLFVNIVLILGMPPLYAVFSLRGGIF